jgi:ABC-type branched-subunit amino acid transport system ATPase component
VTAEGDLDIRGLSVVYGGLRAVDDVSMRVACEGITGLIGPNGAGKSTLIDAVTGFAPIGSGSVWFGGRDITHMRAHRRALANLGRTFQSLELFEDMTVADNVRVTTESATWWKSLTDVMLRWRAKDSDDVAWALELLGLADAADRLPSSLSQAERKAVALARAIVARPKLLMLDEPAAGLDRVETEELGARLRQLAASGPGLLLVDHDMALVLTVCDYVHVLDTGRLIASGTPAEIRGNAEVLRSYLGEEPVAPPPSGGER